MGGLCRGVRAPGSLKDVAPLVPWGSTAWFLVQNPEIPQIAFGGCSCQQKMSLALLDVNCKM